LKKFADQRKELSLDTLDHRLQLKLERPHLSEVKSLNDPNHEPVWTKGAVVEAERVTKWRENVKQERRKPC
jgi:hypothetical protein